MARLGSGLTQPTSLTGLFSYPFLFILQSPFGYLFPFLSLFSLVFALKAQLRKGRPRSITLPPTFSCYLHQRPQAHTFETECHIKDYQLKKKIINYSKKKQVTENLTFILVLLDHTSQEESRNFKGIPGTEEAQRLRKVTCFFVADPLGDNFFHP